MRGLVLIMTAALALMTTLHAASAQGTAEISVERADKTSVPFTVEIASTYSQQLHGLMNRDALPQGQGMLFVYRTPERRAFWMKDTLIPLDILFFGPGGKLIYIAANAVPESLDLLGPDRDDICSVLEIAGGEAARLGIKPGDRLAYKPQDGCK